MFDFNNLVDKGKIGNGAFGNVRLVENKITGQYFALKILNQQSDEIIQNQAFLRESHIMQNLDYASIVKFYGINLYDRDDPTKFNPSILLEYLPNGSLKKTLDEWKKSKHIDYWTITCRSKAILGIAFGMRYLHKNHIIHRDLKPDNIMFNEHYEVCICDFGISRYVSSSENLEMTKFVGSPAYMAPENFDVNHDTYNELVDVYSFSYIAYEIITGKNLFKNPGRNCNAFLKKILNGLRPDLNVDSITDKMKVLLAKCWDADPEKRLSFEEICKILSNDFSYFGEGVDEDELKQYISKLDESNKKDAIQVSSDQNNKSMFKFLQSIIEKIDDFNKIQIDNILFLHYACKLGNFDLVKFLICNLNFDVTSKTIILMFL